MNADTNRFDRPTLSRLYRDGRNRVLFGVCAGVAEYFGIQRWVVRIFAIASLMMFAPPTIVGYLILAVLLPKAPDHLYRDADEEQFWQGVRTDPSQSFAALRHRFRTLEQRLRNMEAHVTSRRFRVNREINDL